MVLQCSVSNCKSRADKETGTRLFCIPSALKNQCAKTILLSERRRAFWIERMNTGLKDQEVKPQTRVCSRHFVTGQTSGLFDFKSPDWGPTLAMGYDQSLLDSIVERQKLSLAEDLRKLELKLQAMFGSPPISTSAIETNKPSLMATTKISAMETAKTYVMETTKSSIVESVSAPIPVENISSDVQMFETLVCEPSICDLPISDQSVDEINEVCEDIPMENFVDPLEDKHALHDALSNGRAGLYEEIDTHKAMLAEITVEKEQLYQKLSEYEQNMGNLRAEMESLRENNSILKNTVANLTLHEDALRNDDSKVAYYTGLPSFTLLTHVFGLVSKKVPDSPLYVLPKFQQFLMVLMRLRLNLQEQDLAYRFNVSVSTISRTFNRWLLAMSSSLEQCVVWPDRESLISSMPLSFKREWGDSVGVIIDCFEIITNKHHNSVKFVIGITPLGTISYISPPHDGCTDDKAIVEECGILNYLVPNDIIMADGSSVAETMGFAAARLVIPATTKGKAQLCYDDAELTKKTSNVRIHVDRLIGRVWNRYSFLKSVLPVEYIVKKDGEEHALIDHIVRVCCSLTNLCPLSVPSE